MRLTERILQIIAPHNCLVCGKEGLLLCNWCSPEAFTSMPERCYRCHHLSGNSKVCKKCQRQTPLRHVWVGGEYDELAKRVIYKLKFDHAPAAADVAADCLDSSLPYLEPGTVVVHVPTSTQRVRQRGFDHARLIAKAVAAQRQLPYVPVLMRLGHQRQVGAKRPQRATQLKGAFWVRYPHIVQGASVLLVDDVMTTGSTLEEAARTLRLAGAKVVNAAVFAQK